MAQGRRTVLIAVVRNPGHWPAPAPATSTTVRYPQRAADAADPYAHVDNLARVRLVMQ